MVKLESGTSSDLFVGFNRPTGINSDNQLASDLVTIVESWSNGAGYSQSMLKATLAAGATYRARRWRGGEDLWVTVGEVRTDVVPGYAEVTARLGDRRDPPAPDPTNKPSEQVRAPGAPFLPRDVSSGLDSPISSFRFLPQPTRIPTPNPTKVSSFPVGAPLKCC